MLRPTACYISVQTKYQQRRDRFIAKIVNGTAIVGSAAMIMIHKKLISESIRDASIASYQQTNPR
jgi:hypothetical protein